MTRSVLKLGEDFKLINYGNFLPFKGRGSSLGTLLMISGTIKASQLKLCTIIVLPNKFQNTKNKFQNTKNKFQNTKNKFQNTKNKFQKSLL